MMCDNCEPGFYGSDCEQICSLNCMNVSCDKISGECQFGCKDDYSGDKCCIINNTGLYCANNTACRECESGYFGQTCNQTCSDLCISNVCEINSGICTEGCKAFSQDDIICVRSQGQGKYLYFTSTKY
jgi:hypothetical protein